VTNLKRSLASVLMPGEDQRWLDVWERVTESVSRWAIGVVVIAAIAGTLQAPPRGCSGRAMPLPSG
jgi:predicted PurR-regulated permease PerM